MHDLHTLPTFAGDGLCHVVVESPRGSTSKFKYDAGHGVIMLSRPLPAGLCYPHDWGFIPSTHASDGDPLDAMVLWDGISYPGVVISCRPVGLLRVEQANRVTRARERNDRLVTVPASAARWANVATIFAVAERVRLELEQFFVAAVAFENKALQLRGWAGPDEAMTLLSESRR